MVFYAWLSKISTSSGQAAGRRCFKKSRTKNYESEFIEILHPHDKTNCVGALIQQNALSIKEVIQPQVPLRLPCYDFTPVMNHTVANAPPKVRLSASGAAHSHGVTGGVYKARERIHRNMLICDY